MSKVIKTNRDGIQLVDNGSSFAIVKPLDSGMSAVLCVGQKNYVQRRWNNEYTIIYDRDPVSGCRMTVYGQEKKDSNMFV